MTTPLPTTLENLAKMGARLEMDASKVLPATAENLVRLSGGNIVFFNAGKFLPTTLENLARAGAGKLTLRFGP
jgi:hypothetical protein